MALQCLCMEFKYWLRQRMSEEGWTQEGLARLIGVTQPTIGQWLRGENRPDPSKLRKLAEVSSADEIELFRLVGYLSEDGDRAVTPAHPLIREIMRELPGLDDDGLRLLRDSIRLLLLPRFGRKGEEDGKAIRRENKE